MRSYVEIWHLLIKGHGLEGQKLNLLNKDSYRKMFEIKVVGNEKLCANMAFSNQRPWP